MAEQPSDSGPTHIREVENGIFNMVITLCQQVQTTMPQEVARTYVATYLRRLADGLESVGQDNTTT